MTLERRLHGGSGGKDREGGFGGEGRSTRLLLGATSPFNLVRVWKCTLRVRLRQLLFNQMRRMKRGRRRRRPCCLLCCCRCLQRLSAAHHHSSQRATAHPSLPRSNKAALRFSFTTSFGLRTPQGAGVTSHTTVQSLSIERV